MNPQSPRQTIFDLGMFDGSDTIYYLRRGYRVVAVEANPHSVEQVQQTCADFIASDQLTVFNAAISHTSGTAEFWVDRDNPSRSSFPQFAYKSAEQYDPVQLDTLTLTELLARFGTPLYLKIDIEGMDIVALHQLENYQQEKPQYISLEIQYANAASTDALLHLHRLGYQHFRIVGQRDHNHFYNPNWLDRRLVWCEDSFTRLMRRKPWEIQNNPVIRTLQFLVRGNQVLTRRALSINDWAFSAKSSGPLPFEHPQPWLSFEEALYEWLHMRQLRRSRSKLDGRKNAWFDVQAALSLD